MKSNQKLECEGTQHKEKTTVPQVHEISWPTTSNFKAKKMTQIVWSAHGYQHQPKSQIEPKSPKKKGGNLAYDQKLK